MAVRTDDGENAVTIRCSYCNKKLIESIEGQFVGVIKCKCGTINNLEGRAGVVTVRAIEGRRLLRGSVESSVVVRSVGEEVRGQTVGEAARDRDRRESRVERGVVVGGVQDSRTAQHSTLVF